MFGPRVPSVGTRTDMYANREPMDDGLGGSQDLVKHARCGVGNHMYNTVSVGLVVNPS